MHAAAGRTRVRYDHGRGLGDRGIARALDERGQHEPEPDGYDRADSRSYLAEWDTEDEEARTLQAGAVTYRTAFGPRAGPRVLTLRGATPREAAARQPLCADIDGLSLHAAVRIEARDLKRLERLCRYITRPALSDERIQVNATGQAELRLKTPRRDGTTHRVLSPLEFMQRLATLVSRPRLHLIRYHGVWRPTRRCGRRGVPQAPAARDPDAGAAGEIRGEAQPVQARATRIGWARLLKRVFGIDVRRCPGRGDPEAFAIRDARHGLALQRCSWGGGCAPFPASGQSPGSRPRTRLPEARSPTAFTPGCVRMGAVASCSPLTMALAAPPGPWPW
ncbi:MAG: transposase [Burkholderiaceae bacterium]|jgi:hypothetical protein|nr:transposase [Burkholderiales bacterium]MCZ8099509.1 transposase [Burkholderiales bacterium]MCZ8336968.1 transposase [Burkholderiaceae bacterium]